MRSLGRYAARGPRQARLFSEGALHKDLSAQMKHKGRVRQQVARPLRNLPCPRPWSRTGSQVLAAGLLLKN